MPPWAYWSPDDWAKAGPECNEIRQKMLGWDLTDFGSGNFEQLGLLLFTIRNGSPDVGAAKNYAEKIMIALPGQITPIHFHWSKAEDAPCMIGEVSRTNNDMTDNRFYGQVGRFPEIEEDEAPLHLLCTEYPMEK